MDWIRKSYGKTTVDYGIRVRVGDRGDRWITREDHSNHSKHGLA